MTRAHIHIGSIMLVVALVAVCLAAERAVRGLGVALTLLALPALVRAAVAVRRCERRGGRVTPLDQMQAFLDSFGIVLITAVACCIAFTVTCFPAGYVAFAAQSSVGIFVAFGIGFLCAGWVLWRLARRIWPIRDD